MEYDTIFAAARRAGNELALVDAGRLSRTVVKAAALLRENAGKVLAANALDLEAMDADSPMRDRLRLTAERIASIAADMESVAGLPSPQGETIAEWTRPNGMTLRKVRVPFGVVGMICEARPNVTADIFSLSMKTGNACVLKGGSDARRSNEAIAVLLREALRSEWTAPAGRCAPGVPLSKSGTEPLSPAAPLPDTGGRSAPPWPASLRHSPSTVAPGQRPVPASRPAPHRSGEC